VFVMISSMSASICKRFHATQVAVKITTFRGYPLLMPACAVLFEARGSELAAIKSTLNLESKSDICKLHWSISSHFGAIQS